MTYPPTYGNSMVRGQIMHDILPMQPVMMQHHHAPVVMSQPQTTVIQNTTNVNTHNSVNANQEKVYVQQPPRPRQWSTTLCDCCQDIPSCCLGWICPCILTCWIASRYNESCCIGCLPYLSVALRTKIRVANNIQGSICDDFCCLCWLTQCALCQMHRELNHIGIV